jgi:hypothetical protein
MNETIRKSFTETNLSNSISMSCEKHSMPNDLEGKCFPSRQRPSKPLLKQKV